jgi:hypothetical protein
MKIEELDEFQGITSEMIQAWLLATGWKQVEQMAYQLDAPPVRTGWLFRRGDETVGTGADISYVLAKLSRLSCKTPQALLREINPRMRKGWPSEEALSAHPFWLLNNAPIHCLPSVVTSRFVREKKHRSDPEFADVAPHYAWPCDANGNKVRWPTDADGKML